MRDAIWPEESNYALPSVMITDNETALRNAIDVVFPEVQHLLCSWHLWNTMESKLPIGSIAVEEWRLRKLVVEDDSNVIPSDVTVSHLMALRQFMSDPNAHFKSIEQSAAIAIVLDRVQDLLWVSGTSQGKSLAIYFTSFYERHLTTVVVVPLVSLKADMMER
ncbi:hypothetical protein MBANPS3_011988 [Mucor bainieri]